MQNFWRDSARIVMLKQICDEALNCIMSKLLGANIPWVTAGGLTAAINA
jgi:hypothetical protein